MHADCSDQYQCTVCMYCCAALPSKHIGGTRIALVHCAMNQRGPSWPKPDIVRAYYR